MDRKISLSLLYFSCFIKALIFWLFFLKIEAVIQGFQSNTTVQQVLSQLVNLTQPVVNNTERPPEVFGRDLVIAVDILVTLADFNTQQGNVSTEEDVENFAQVSSNLLEPTNRITWEELDQVSISVYR